MSLGNEGQKDIEIPAVFALSTVLIGASSFMIHPIHSLFKAEEIPSLLTALRFTFFLGLGFALCQFLGWKALRESDVLFSSNVTSSFFLCFDGGARITLFSSPHLSRIFNPPNSKNF